MVGIIYIYMIYMYDEQIDNIFIFFVNENLLNKFGLIFILL